MGLKAGCGLDIGTATIISGREKENGVEYSLIRDAYFKIKPSTPLAGSMIEKGLAGKKFYKDSETNTFYVLGEDAIGKAIEKNESAERPMKRGVLSPGQKDAFPVLKALIKDVVGEPIAKGEKLIYSIPAAPVDESSEDFSVGYHQDFMKTWLTALGYDAEALNEATAVAYSELLDNDLTGMVFDYGAGMVNIVIVAEGEEIFTFSVVRSGDWVDRNAAIATNLKDSVVQMEKEKGGVNIFKPNDSDDLHLAIAGYYKRMIEYSVAYTVNALKNKNLNNLRDMPVVIAGGTSLIDGFVEVFKNQLTSTPLQFNPTSVERTKNGIYTIARGCTIATSI
jgi:hypothetical protein